MLKNRAVRKVVLPAHLKHHFLFPIADCFSMMTDQLLAVNFPRKAQGRINVTKGLGRTVLSNSKFLITILMSVYWLPMAPNT